MNIHMDRWNISATLLYARLECCRLKVSLINKENVDRKRTDSCHSFLQLSTQMARQCSKLQGTIDHVQAVMLPTYQTLGNFQRTEINEGLCSFENTSLQWVSFVHTETNLKWSNGKPLGSTEICRTQYVETQFMGSWCWQTVICQ